MIIGDLVISTTQNNIWHLQNKTNHNYYNFWKYINFIDEQPTLKFKHKHTLTHSGYLENNRISIQASRICTLADFLKIYYKNTKLYALPPHLILKFISDIGTQLHSLDKHRQNLLYLEITNIMVIIYDDSFFNFTSTSTSLKFIYVSTDSIVNIDEHDNVIVNIPFSKHLFISPELFSLSTLPGYIHKSCSYYSLILIAILLLTDFHHITHNTPHIFNTSNPEHILKYIEEFKGGKLYHLIERIIAPPDPADRAFLYI
jgi:hypothetical protein